MSSLPGKSKAKSGATIRTLITIDSISISLTSYLRFPDKTRGILNEGGLFAERAGWHLPGFDVSSWEHRAPVDGLPSNNAGIGFFVTTFELHIPEGYDVPISFVFEDGESGEETPYRALLFVNGWNFGKRIANLGYAHLSS
jgi:hypothetical protein